MYATVRRYAKGGALADAMTSKETEVTQIISSVPGFVAYYATRDGDNMTSITVCNDKAGTDESTRRAAEWVKENVKGSPPSAPDVTAGDVFISFSK